MSENIFKEIVSFIRKVHGKPSGPIPLHQPSFSGNEKKYLTNCIDSTFVSSVGQYVTEFEKAVANYVNTRHAVATMNGTSALHLSLVISGVMPGDEIITQALGFIATANAIEYCGAKPIFLDSDRSTGGMNPSSLENFVKTNCRQGNDGQLFNIKTGCRISACVPIHILGHPLKINKILTICDKLKIPLIEDAAESLGSFFQKKHTGTFGRLGIISFNGNKIITTGGGGMIITDDDDLAHLAKHLSTTAKTSTNWEYLHDKIGYNYRLPNINAALGCAQIELIEDKLIKKRELASAYQIFFNSKGIPFIKEPLNCKSNFWLNALIFDDVKMKDDFLRYTNDRGIETRPLWNLISDLPMYAGCQKDELTNARWLQEHIVCIPSGVDA